ncbi:BREX system Lon protease-like protein BrxL [Rhodoblastus sp.]|uniref:BREX system Lon protease-like protein BrxL n=1 Tax=Rhodoblastus sp. TaxID=1962975 RepID=UPI003F9704BD
MSFRVKLLFITRLIPLCERNYNLVELGPRGTGKSYVVQEVSPYAALMTGPTTVANLFGHMGGRSKGLVQIWDVVGFDEVADLEKMPKEVITTMKTYCESGQYQRGQEAASGEASMAMFGKKSDLSIARELDVSDLHVEVIDLLNNRVEGEIGLGFFVAAISALKKAPPIAALLITGDLSVQGNIKGLRSLVEPLQVAMDNGARRALIPLENKRNFLEVTGDIMEHVDPIFFSDPKTAAFKALGLN